MFFMQLSLLFSFIFSIAWRVLSFLFWIARKLHLTLPLTYLLLTATFLNSWAASHEKIAFVILFALLGLSVIRWIFSIKKFLQDTI